MRIAIHPLALATEAHAHTTCLPMVLRAARLALSTLASMADATLLMILAEVHCAQHLSTVNATKRLASAPPQWAPQRPSANIRRWLMTQLAATADNAKLVFVWLLLHQLIRIPLLDWLFLFLLSALCSEHYSSSDCCKAEAEVKECREEIFILSNVLMS